MGLCEEGGEMDKGRETNNIINKGIIGNNVYFRLFVMARIVEERDIRGKRRGGMKS